MRGVPAWQRRYSVQHPSSVSALRADPPSPTRGEGKCAGPVISSTKIELFSLTRAEPHLSLSPTNPHRPAGTPR
ncbi:MAG: hypothetical protein E5W93_16795 [Mesorhizobium sp.]|nr:MAG: hypothetical protein E5W93_16795 [Mesorhizobium sp.]